MNHVSLKRRTALALASVSLLGASASAEAGTVYGLNFDTADQSVTLIRFDSATPSNVTTIGPITGLSAGQSPAAIDFRPATGRLYLGAGGSPEAALYTLDLNTAAATQVGPGFDPTNPEFGNPSFDFDPVRDELRVVTNANSENTRTNTHGDPDLGGRPEIDTDIAFAPGDPNAGTPNTEVAGIAYTNNVVGAASTTLYGYELRTDTIVRIGGPGGVPSANTGQLTTIGSSGIISPGDLGFDISDAGEALISTPIQGRESEGSRLFNVNLETSALDDIGLIGTAAGTRVFDIAVAPSGVTPIPLPAAAAMFPLAAAVAGLSAWRARRRMVRA
jgi:hypothetical protein